jgi:sulfoxide reductase heme-binding subunit YedZ
MPWRDRNGEVSGLKAATFALMFYPAIWSAYHLAVGGFGPLPIVGLVYWSGVWALALLLAALAVTPVARIFDWRRLVVIRRMVGVSALAYTLAHVVIYAALYRWDVTVLVRDMTTRTTLIVASISTIGLLALGATSTDAAVRRLGGGAWKRLHRTNYLLTALAVVHFLLSPGIFMLQYLAAGVFVWLMAWRWLDRRGRGTDPASLAGLAVVVSVFTILMEAAWLRAYQGVEAGQTLGDNATLEVGLTAGWWVLLLGLVAALGPRLLRRAHALLPHLRGDPNAPARANIPGTQLSRECARIFRARAILLGRSKARPVKSSPNRR